jgi:murein DD-endopeptidase MepM/ murein hydrolase activator NlpD
MGQKPQPSPFHNRQDQVGVSFGQGKPCPMKSVLFARIVGILATTTLLSAGLVQDSPTYGAQNWGWPMKPARLSSGFDRPPQNWLPGHRGVDLVGRSGVKILAAGSGVITFAGLVAGKGVVVIKHGKLRTTYEPVTASVTVGSRVRVGDVIGTLSPGESHCATETTVSCLHWGLIQGKTYLNPLLLVKKPVRLLPRV